MQTGKVEGKEQEIQSTGVLRRRAETTRVKARAVFPEPGGPKNSVIWLGGRPPGKERWGSREGRRGRWGGRGEWRSWKAVKVGSRWVDLEAPGLGGCVEVEAAVGGDGAKSEGGCGAGGAGAGEWKEVGVGSSGGADGAGCCGSGAPVGGGRVTGSVGTGAFAERTVGAASVGSVGTGGTGWSGFVGSANTTSSIGSVGSGLSAGGTSGAASVGSVGAGGAGGRGGARTDSVGFGGCEEPGEGVGGVGIIGRASGCGSWWGGRVRLGWWSACRVVKRVEWRERFSHGWAQGECGFNVHAMSRSNDCSYGPRESRTA